MAQQNRTSLKNFFQTGKVPTQGQYEDLIDSSLNLSETDTQIIQGELSSSTINTAYHITASGDISSSGDIIAATGSFGVVTGSNLSLEADNDVRIRLDNKSEGSGYFRIYEGASANPFWQVKDDGKTVMGGSVLLTSTDAMLTVNGDISASATSTISLGTASLGIITGSDKQNTGVNFETPVTASKDITCLGTIYGTLGTTSEVTTLGTLTALNVNGNTHITASTMKINMSSTTPLSITGSISSSGGLTARGEISGSFISSSHGISTLGDIKAVNLDMEGSASFDSTIKAASIGTDTGNNVVILNSSNLLKTDAINSDVWDTSKNFVDASSGVQYRIPTFTDADSIQGESGLTFNGSALSVTGTLTVTGRATVAGLTTTAVIGIDQQRVEIQEVSWSNGDSIVVDGDSKNFVLAFLDIPPIISKTGTAEYMVMQTGGMSSTSVVLGTPQNVGSGYADLVPVFYKLIDGSCRITWTSGFAGTGDVSGGKSATINVTII